MLLFLLIACCQCDNSHQNAKGKNFNDYISHLKEIDLPFVYSSSNLGIQSKIPNLNENELSKYKFWNKETIGKLIQTKDFTIIVERRIGDYLTPTFITYDKNGNQIESFVPYKKTGNDMGYNSIEHVTVDKTMTVTVIDSTTLWKLNSEKTNIIRGSDSLTVGKTIYHLNNNGLFK